MKLRTASELLAYIEARTLIDFRETARVAVSLDTREHALVEALRELEMRAREVMPVSDEGIMDFHKLGSALSAARAALALYDGEEKGCGDASG